MYCCTQFQFVNFNESCFFYENLTNIWKQFKKVQQSIDDSKETEIINYNNNIGTYSN